VHLGQWSRTPTTASPVKSRSNPTTARAAADNGRRSVGIFLIALIPLPAFDQMNPTVAENRQSMKRHFEAGTQAEPCCVPANLHFPHESAGTQHGSACVPSLEVPAH